MWDTHVNPWGVHGAYMGKGWPLGGERHVGVYLGFAHGFWVFKGGIKGRGARDGSGQQSLTPS